LDFSGVVPFAQSGEYPVDAEESDERLTGDEVNDDRFCRVYNGSSTPPPQIPSFHRLVFES